MTGPLQDVIGLSKVAKTLPQARPIGSLLRRGQCRAASESGTPLTTRPLSYRHVERDPLGVLVLIAEDAGGLERLVVIDAENAAGQRLALRDQPAVSGRK